MILIVGLGNPGEEYKTSRHNTGFIVLDNILGKVEWKQSSGTKACYYKDTIGKKEVEYFKPQTFMNNSGVAVSFAQTKHKIKSQNVIVIYDDIDLPIGSFKISFNRSSGGHNGLESIIKKIKSREFVRIRIGISPVTPSGKIKKPKGEQAILKFLLGQYKEAELKELKKVSKKVAEALEIIVTESKEKAMSLYN
ncbi:MAG: aminoacyl-tRNA hydrolase [Candidatus Paceibacterota bacterium]|jgi:PTH1 family peptidyl-tRNA hydrolase